MHPALRPKKKPPAGCLIPFGLIFLAAGLAVCWLAWTKILTQVKMVHSWTETPCQVTQWEVQVEPGGEVYKVAPKISYDYDFNGQHLTGHTYDAASSITPALNDFEEQGASARAGGAVCYVNPAQPGESSFRRGSYAAGGFVLGMGVLFAGVGGLIVLGGVFSLFRPGGGQEAATGRMARGCAGGILAPIFFSLFAGTGFAVWKLALQDEPDWKTISGRMVTVPSRVIASGVKTSRSSGKNSSTTYKAMVAFSYEWNGRTWHSGWLDFDRSSSSSSNSTKAREAVSRYPAGATPVAWVDPEAPWVAVLEKQGGTRWWLWLFPILFGGVGLIGLAWWLLKLTALGAALLGAKRSPGE